MKVVFSVSAMLKWGEKMNAEKNKSASRTKRIISEKRLKQEKKGYDILGL